MDLEKEKAWPVLDTDHPCVKWKKDINFDTSHTRWADTDTCTLEPELYSWVDGILDATDAISFMVRSSAHGTREHQGGLKARIISAYSELPESSGEYMGMLTYNKENKAFKFEVDSHLTRTRSPYSVGKTVRAKSLDSAVTSAITWLKPKDLEKLWDKQKTELSSEVSNTRTSYHSYELENITQYMALNHYDFLEQSTCALLGEDKGKSVLDSIFKKAVANNMREGIRAGQGCFIRIDGVGNYIIGNVTNSSGIQTKTFSELPSAMRMDIGKMKLMQNGSAILDLGFKHTDNSFYLLKDWGAYENQGG